MGLLAVSIPLVIIALFGGLVQRGIRVAGKRPEVHTCF
jgi:hypothetical protein